MGKRIKNLTTDYISGAGYLVVDNTDSDETQKYDVTNLTGKADKITSPTVDTVLSMDANGDLKDSGYLVADMLQQNANRNGLINPACLISQRGDYTSATSATNNTYYIDRFRTMVSTVSANVQHISAAQPTDLSGTKSIKLIATSAATGYMIIDQPVFDYERYQGKTVTFSARVKSAKASDVNVMIKTSDGTTVGSTEHSGSGWETLSVTATIGSTISFLYVQVGVSDGSAVSIAIADYVEATGFVLNYGIAALPSVHRDSSTEKMLCNCYFRRIKDTATFTIAQVACPYNATNLYGTFSFGYPMIQAPTTTIKAISNWYRTISGGGISVLGGSSIDTTTVDEVVVIYTSSGMVPTEAYSVVIRGNDNISFDSELYT